MIIITNYYTHLRGFVKRFNVPPVKTIKYSIRRKGGTHEVLSEMRISARGVHSRLRKGENEEMSAAQAAHAASARAAGNVRVPDPAETAARGCAHCRNHPPNMLSSLCATPSAPS